MTAEACGRQHRLDQDRIEALSNKVGAGWSVVGQHRGHSPGLCHGARSPLLAEPLPGSRSPGARPGGACLALSLGRPLDPQAEGSGVRVGGRWSHRAGPTRPERLTQGCSGAGRPEDRRAPVQRTVVSAGQSAASPRPCPSRAPGPPGAAARKEHRPEGPGSGGPGAEGPGDGGVHLRRRVRLEDLGLRQEAPGGRGRPRPCHLLPRCGPGTCAGCRRAGGGGGGGCSPPARPSGGWPWGDPAHPAPPTPPHSPPPPQPSTPAGTATRCACACTSTGTARGGAHTCRSSSW